ncbi:hypothetical protein C8F04DRAFT_1397027, partial [Mycena alexandri]
MMDGKWATPTSARQRHNTFSLAVMLFSPAVTLARRLASRLPTFFKSLSLPADERPKDHLNLPLAERKRICSE